MQSRLHFLVSGVVQGVFFRGTVQREALTLGLKGWVRNLDDGRVECVAEGDKESLEKLLVWARRGPPGAVVEKVDFYWETATGAFKNFIVTG
ncbi:MAG: acylphosphatase [Candidatus Micrarchaeota archaeon]